ncbi:MAG: hypothetical protein M3347_10235 [Armatimonadota bacterium]|nr:hypothetical protein [Armatimonadota bacterium]
MTPQEKIELRRKIDVGAKAAVAEAIEEHRRMGRSIAIWRDGQVVWLTPDQIPARTPETTDNGQQTTDQPPQ